MTKADHRFHVIQRVRFAGDHPGRGRGELGLGATQELRIGDAINFVGRREISNAGADLLDDAGKVRTESERRLRANLALALTDDCIPGERRPRPSREPRISFGPGDGISASSTATTSGGPKLLSILAAFTASSSPP